MTLLTLPWPPRLLSPNVRQCYHSLARAKAKYRHACWGECVAQLKPAIRAGFPRDAKLTIELQFCPPSRRRFDEDGLISRMKAGLDGIADALQVDDHQFKLAAPQMGSVVKGGAVYVRITEEPKPC